MTTPSIRSSSPTADRELTATRILDAPPERVFELWTDPRHLARWWGPEGFSTTTYHMDVKPGGVWRFVMHGPDGADYENKITYVEVVENRRLVYKHGGVDDAEVNFEVTATFEPHGPGGKQTKLELRSLFPSAAALKYAVEKYGAAEGLKQHVTRLDERLHAVAAGKVDTESEVGDRELIISRVYDAPRSAVWKAWTDPEQLKRWWTPRPVQTVACEIDLRPGGVFRTTACMPDGKEYRNEGRYRGVVENERLVFFVAALDEQDKPWIEILVTVTFEDAGGDPRKTKLTATVHHKTKADRDRHNELGFRDGWGAAWEQLAEVVER
jgi:uncharacterized protein YndB with AHSA1/START domain